MPAGLHGTQGLLAKYLFEKIAGIHTDVSTSSEFRYGDPVMRNDVLTVAITQSGETADTLAAIRSTSQYGCNSIAITNVVGSTITRETDNVIYTRAGPEIGVAGYQNFYFTIANPIHACHLFRENTIPHKCGRQPGNPESHQEAARTNPENPGAKKAHRKMCKRVFRRS